MKNKEFKEVYENAEEVSMDEMEQKNFEDENEKPTFFERIKESKWTRRVGWGLLAVTVAAAGAVLLAGCSEDEEDVVDGYLEKKDDESSEISQSETESGSSEEN